MTDCRDMQALRASGTPDAVWEMLLFFLWECPASMIPAQADVASWQRALETRPDAHRFTRHLSECREWLDA